MMHSSTDRPPPQGGRPIKGYETMTKTMTPKELAAELDTDAKLLRSFLRSNASGVNDLAPGKGGRWAIPAAAKNLRDLRKKFAAWEIARAKEIEAARNARKDAEGDADDAPSPEDTPNAPEGDEVTED